jgi:hypothetical protein
MTVAGSHPLPEISSTSSARKRPRHRPTDHAIDLESGAKLPYGRIYSLSEVELKAWKAYIETNLASGFIQRSSSAAAWPILFFKRKDGSSSVKCSTVGIPLRY